MVLKPEPLFEAVESLLGHGVGAPARKNRGDPKNGDRAAIRGGQLFDQKTGPRYSQLERVIFIADGMKGVDERVGGGIWLRKKSPLATSC